MLQEFVIYARMLMSDNYYRKQTRHSWSHITCRLHQLQFVAITVTTRSVKQMALTLQKNEDCSKWHLVQSSAIHTEQAIYTSQQTASKGLIKAGQWVSRVWQAGRNDRHTVSEHFLHRPKHNYPARRYAERPNAGWMDEMATGADRPADVDNIIV